MEGKVWAGVRGPGGRRSRCRNKEQGSRTRRKRKIETEVAVGAGGGEQGQEAVGIGRAGASGRGVPGVIVCAWRLRFALLVLVPERAQQRATWFFIFLCFPFVSVELFCFVSGISFLDFAGREVC